MLEYDFLKPRDVKNSSAPGLAKIILKLELLGLILAFPACSLLMLTIRKGELKTLIA